MARYQVAEYIYQLPDVYTVKLLTMATAALSKLGTDRTPMEEEAMIHGLKMLDLLQKD